MCDKIHKIILFNIPYITVKKMIRKVLLLLALAVSVAHAMAFPLKAKCSMKILIL